MVFLRGLLDETLAPRFTFVSFILLLLIGLLWKPITQISLRFISTPALLLGGFYLLHLASCFWATNFGEALFESQKVLLCLVVFLLTIGLMQQDAKRTLKHFSLAGVIYLSVLLIFIGPQLYELLSIGFDRHSVMRLYGFSGNKNMLAALLLLLLLWLPCYWQFSKKKVIKPFLVLLGLFYVFVLYQLETRSVYVAGGLAFFVLLLYKLQKPLGRWVAPLTQLPMLSWVLLLGISLFNGLFLMDRQWNIMTPGSSTGTLYQRAVIWSKSMDLFTQYPLAGVGAGNWKVQFPSVGMEGLKGADTHQVFFNRPHNDFIQVLTELGTLGFLLYTGLYLILCYSFYKRLRKKSQPTPLAVWLSYTSLLVLMSFSLFSFPKERIEFQVLLGIFLGIACYQLKDELPKLGIKIGQPSRLLCGLLGVLLGFNLFLGGLRIRESQKAFVWEQAYQNNQLSALTSNVKYTVHPLKNMTTYGTPMDFFGAMQAWEVQDYEGAVAQLKRAVRANPGHLASHTNLGAAHIRLGEYEQALGSFEKALQISSSHADTLYNIALIYFSQGDWEQAKIYTQRLPDSDPRKRILMEKMPRS